MRRNPFTVAILVAVVLGSALPAVAVAAGIRATVNTTETTIQDPIVLSVTVEGAQRVEPTLPELADFRVMPRGSSSEVQIVNGRMSSSVTYTYLLVPLGTGTFTIGPATVVIDGQTFSSRPFQVKVVEAAAQPSDSDYLFVRASISNPEPYVGEQVLYTWRFYRRVQVANARLESMDFAGLVAEDLGDVREYTTTVNGLEYMVSEIRKALFAQEGGEVTLPPTRLSCEVAVRPSRRRRSVFDDFFARVQTQTKSLSTAPIELHVRELPEPPTGFSGLVGDFQLTSSISKRELQVGESATLELTLQGTGNVFLMGEPALPELADFKAYPDKPTSSVDRSAAGLEGRKTFRTALVPLRPGSLTVPAVELTYFDPKAAEFRRAATEDLVLDVRPSEGKEELMLTESVAPTTGKVAVKILADDILPIYRQLDAVDPQLPSGVAAVLWQAGFVLPPFAFLALVVVRRRQARYSADAGLRRREGALRRATTRVKRLRSLEGRSSELAQEGSRILREFIGDKLNSEGSALTPAETAALLERRSVSEERLVEVRTLLGRCEAAQYGTAGSDLEAAALAAELSSLLPKLDRALSRRRS